MRPVTENVVDSEVMARYRTPGIYNANGLWEIGPMVIPSGTDEQKEMWVRDSPDTDQHWCQRFSEPQAGSDLASLRTTAVLGGNRYGPTGKGLGVVPPTSLSGLSFLFVPIRWRSKRAANTTALRRSSTTLRRPASQFVRSRWLVFNGPNFSTQKWPPHRIAVEPLKSPRMQDLGRRIAVFEARFGPCRERHQPPSLRLNLRPLWFLSF